MPEFQLPPPAEGRPATLLEEGRILRWKPPAFALDAGEQALIAASRIGGDAKNISFDVSAGLRHAEGAPADLAVLEGMLSRFGAFCETALAELLPEYRGGLRRGRTSFRPAEIEGRSTSWRRDDKRRHIDAFPSAPTGGQRILRVFCNVDQDGQPRIWRIGPNFESYARAFLPRATVRPLPGLGALKTLTGLTRSRPTLYDAQMLALHDAAKRDLAWQRDAPAEEIAFTPGEVWMVFTDLVPHAAISGRNALEQTFLVDQACLALPERSPLVVLSRMSGRDMRRAI
jgi:hypothetical protein